MANRYWVGGGGTWTSTTKWSASSGGASGASVPTTFDDVFFDANSGFGANAVINLNASIGSSRNLNFTGCPNNPTITNGVLNSTGDITMPLGSVKVIITEWILDPPSDNHRMNIDTNGNPIYCAMMNEVGSGAVIELKSDLYLNPTPNWPYGFSIFPSDTTFISNGYTITTPNFTTDTDFIGTVDFTGSTINIEQRGTSGLTLFDIPSSGTVIMDETIVNCRKHGNLASISGEGVEYETLNIIGSGTISLANSLVADTINIESGITGFTINEDIVVQNMNIRKGAGVTISAGDIVIDSLTMAYDSDLTINSSNNLIRSIELDDLATMTLGAGIEIKTETIETTSSSGANAVILSGSAGTFAYINVLKNTIQTNYLTITDIYQSGEGVWYAGSNSTNGGGNINILFSSIPSRAIDKEVIYSVFSSLGSSLGVLESVVSDFGVSNEVNTTGGVLNIDVKRDNSSEYDSRFEVGNILKIHIRNIANPNGYLVFKGYVGSIRTDYENNLISLSVNPYSEKLSKYIHTTPLTLDYDNSTYSTDTWTYSYDTYQGSILDSFTTGVGVTSLKAIAVYVSKYYSDDIDQVMQAHIFSSKASAQASASTPLASSSETSIESGSFSWIVCTLPETLTVTESTTYWVRIDGVYEAGVSSAQIKFGLDSAGSHSIKTFPTWAWADVATSDLLLRTYTGVEDTTVTYTNADVSDILRSALDSQIAQGGVITYNALSVEDTGVLVTYTTNSDSVKATIDFCLSSAPKGWTYYIDPATNVFYFRAERSTELIDHTIAMGDSIKSMVHTKNFESLANTVYFTGGDTGGGSNLFVKDYDQSSVTKYGIVSVSLNDSRVTTTATAQEIISAYLDRYSEPVDTVVITLEDLNKGVNTQEKGYNIESLELQQNVRITGLERDSIWDLDLFDLDEYVSTSYIGGLVLQIVRVDYSRDSISITLNIPLESSFKYVAKTKRAVDVLNTVNNPTAPS